MPVRSTIHSSLVSRRAARSALVTTVSGRAAPQPVTAAPRTSGRAGGLEPGDGLSGGDALSRHHHDAHEPAGEGGADLDHARGPGGDGAGEGANPDDPPPRPPGIARPRRGEDA